MPRVLTVTRRSSRPVALLLHVRVDEYVADLEASADRGQPDLEIGRSVSVPIPGNGRRLDGGKGRAGGDVTAVEHDRSPSRQDLDVHGPGAREAPGVEANDRADAGGAGTVGEQRPAVLERRRPGRRLDVVGPIPERVERCGSTVCRNRG